MLNSTPFAVTPGAAFDAIFQGAIGPGSEGSGYLAVIFLDANGKETRRARLPLQPAWQSLGKARTDRNGTVVVGATEGGHDLSVRATFAGDDLRRPATASLH